MKKCMSFLLCLMLLVSMAVPVQAEEIEIHTSDETTSVTEHVCSYQLTSDTATCTAVGVKTYTCSCGATKTEDSPLKDHSYGSPINVDASIHKTVCSLCGNETPAPHSWDGGTVTTQANCKQEGVKTYRCSCGAAKTESLPRTDHAWNKNDPAKHICTVCAQEAAHSLKEEVTQKPTCEHAGVKTKTCTVCGYKMTEAVPKLTTHTYDNACDGECNVCAIKRDVQHTFTTAWSKDYNGHWHECTKCGEKSDFAKHTAGPAATEENDQVCTVCKYVITNKKEHEHDFEKEWTSDEAGHWHACTGKTCDAEKDYASHSFDNDCDEDCSVCGYKRENVHKYDTEGWNTTKFEHWNICAVCREESPHEKHVPGPDATEKEPRLCTVCGFEIAPKLEHTHDFGREYLSAKDSHWQECECGELSVPEPHTWDKGKKNRNDTITYRCVLCDTEKIEEIPSSGFPWLTLVLILLALICLGGIVALVIILKRGGFEDEEEQMDDFDEEEEMTPQPDEEEQAIDDFFASLDEELYK